MYIENNLGVKIEFKGEKIGSGTDYKKEFSDWNEVGVYHLNNGNYLSTWKHLESMRNTDDIIVYISISLHDLFLEMTANYDSGDVPKPIKDAFKLLNMVD